MNIRGRPRHIAIFGNFGIGNLGNEASLKAMMDFLRRNRPDAEITVVCHGLEAVQREHGVPTAPIRLPPPSATWIQILNRLMLKLPWRLFDIVRAFRDVRKFDIIVVPGTGILDDFGERWQAMPYDLFKWSLAAKLSRRPFAFVNIGAGPIQHPLSTWLMASAARMAQYCSYRDEISKTYIEGLGIRGSQDPVFPDLAFNLPVPECALDRHQDNLPPTIGLGVMNYHGWNCAAAESARIHETYQSQIARFAVWLLAKGYRVRFLVGAWSDQGAIEDILRRVAATYGVVPATQILAKPAASLNELMRQIVETDIVVATRFHNIVAALMVCRPVLSIGYAAKNAALLTEVGLGPFHQEADRLDFDLLIEQFEELLQRREELTKRVEDAMERFRRLLNDQESNLLTELL